MNNRPSEARIELSKERSKKILGVAKKMRDTNLNQPLQNKATLWKEAWTLLYDIQHKQGLFDDGCLGDK